MRTFESSSTVWPGEAERVGSKVEFAHLGVIWRKGSDDLFASGSCRLCHLQHRSKRAEPSHSLQAQKGQTETTEAAVRVGRLRPNPNRTFAAQLLIVSHAGRTRLLLTQHSLSQKLLASAAPLVGQCSGFRQTSHSSGAMLPKRQLSFRRIQMQQKGRATKPPLSAGFRSLKARNDHWC